MQTIDQPDLAVVLEFYGLTIPPRFGWVSARCIFHEDRTASAAVNVNENKFTCFTCDLSEDAIGVIQLQEGLDFIGALRFSADTFGTSNGEIRKPRRTSRRVLKLEADQPGDSGDRSPGLRRRSTGRP